MSKATYRDLKVVAVSGDEESSPFTVRQNTAGEAVPERLVLRLDQGKERQDGSPQINVNNGDYKVFGNHRQAWIEEKLTGYRKKVGDTVCISVRILPSGVPTAKELEAVTETF